MRALSTKELALVIVSQALKPSVIELHNPRALNALTLVIRAMNEHSLAWQVKDMASSPSIPTPSVLLEQ